MFTKRENLQDKTLDFCDLSKKLQYELKYIDEYIVLTHETIVFNNNQIEDKMYDDTKSDPEHESVIQQLHDTQRKTLTSYYYHSTIVLIYSIMEDFLSDICHEIKKSIFTKFSHDDLYGKSLIKKSIDYIQLTSNSETLDIEAEFNEIKKFQRLRNIIVHQNSGFSGSDDDIKKQKKFISKNFPDINISDENNKFYILNHHLIFNFSSLVNLFITKIINHIQSLTYQIDSRITNSPISDENIPF